MAIYLKDPEVDELAREVAKLEGSSITEAISRALCERKRKLMDAREAKRQRVEKVIAKIRALPVLDDRHPDEMLYDEYGVPK
jgi:antitoxin VapB